MRRAAGGDELEAQAREGRADRDGCLFVDVANREEGRPSRRQRSPGGPLGLRERSGQVGGGGHHLARRAHLGTEHRVGAGEARERQDGCFDTHL